MTFLDQFRETILETKEKKIEVFRMDNRTAPDMRKYAGLGACNCCDYFFINDDKIFVVEDTRLADTVKTIEGEYSYLNDDDKQDWIVKNVRQENYVKVYGSLLVLCRLAAKYKDVAKHMKDKKHDFWFVVQGVDSEETRKAFEYLSTRLFEDLRSVLTKKVVDKVEIIPSDLLFKKLAENAPTH